MGGSAHCSGLGRDDRTLGLEPATGVSREFCAEREGVACTANHNATSHTSSFLLTAKQGRITVPDSNSIYMWGFANQNGAFQYPGPVLCVEAGDTVTITLNNRLPGTVNTSIQFPGFENVRANGAPESTKFDGSGNLTSLATPAPHNGTVTYAFKADNPGTYLYQSGTDPEFQVQMGLFGIIIVHPHVDASASNGTPSQDETDLAYTLTAYLKNQLKYTVDATTVAAAAQDAPRVTYAKGIVNGQLARYSSDQTAPTTTETGCANSGKAGHLDVTDIDPQAIYSANHEYMMVLSEVDPDLHAAADPALGAITSSDQYKNPYHAHYFFINGRGLPDNLAPNSAAWLPSQPYGAMAHIEPFQPVQGKDVNGVTNPNGALKANPMSMTVHYASVGVTSYPMHPHSNHERVIAVDAHPLRRTGLAYNDPAGDLSEEHFAVVVNPGGTEDTVFKWTNVEDYADTTNARTPVPVPNSLNLTEGDLFSGTPYLGDKAILNPGITQNDRCGEYYHVVHSHNLTQATNYGVTFGGMLSLIRVDPGEPVTGTNGCKE